MKRKFDTRVMQGWDDIAKLWVEEWKNLREWQLEERVKFARHFKSGLILDLGCGSGRDVKVFNDLGLTCIGLDFSRKMLELSNGSDYVCADMNKIPFKNNTFDGVWSCSTMKYLTRDQMLISLREVKRVLKCGGFFWLSLEEGEGEKMDDKYGVKMVTRLYTEKTLLPILKTAGFEVLKTERIKAWRNFINITSGVTK